MIEPIVHTARKDTLPDFLQLRGFEVETVGENVLRVVREGELPTYVNISETSLFFEVDLGDLREVACEELYLKLLDANSEILPVSFGINNADDGNPRLVLLESLLHGDLCDSELLGVFDALELAADKAAEILQPYLETTISNRSS